MSPTSDLEERICETYRLIREYEEIERLNADPLEKTRARKAIEQQQAVLVEAMEQYVRLCRATSSPVAQEIAEIAAVRGIELATAPAAVTLSTPHHEPPHQAISAVDTTMQELANLVQQWPIELAEALQRGSLVPFIGADLPREVTGLPSRADLAAALAQRYGLDPSLPLAEVSQRVGQGGNRHHFTSFLLNALDTHTRAPQPFHRRIATLVNSYKLTWLISTAYDDLLEQAFRDMQVRINRVVRSSDLPFIHRDSPTLIKLYGDIRDKESLVITSDDHYGLWRSREKESILNEVRAILSRSLLLFIGYNLNDPDFRLLWHELHDQMGNYAATAYALSPHIADDERQVWRDRGVTLLELPLL